MKETLSNISFVVLSSILGGALGMILSRWLIPKGVGLAGGPMVLGYGLLGLFLALIGSLMINPRLSRQQLSIGNFFLFLLTATFIGWLTFKLNQ